MCHIQPQVQLAFVAPRERTERKTTQKQDKAPARKDRIVAYWQTIQPYLFPLVPKSAESFVSLMFWHSMITTASTPLHRYVSGGWKGISTLFWMISSWTPKWFSGAVLEHGIGIPYPQDGEVVANVGQVKGIDRAFGLHAFFSLCWLVVSYVEIVHARKIHPKVHRYLGYVATAIFLGHCFGGLNNVYSDIVHHTAIVKLMFIATVLDHMSQFFRALYYAIRRKNANWRQLHQDEMAILFLGSIGGAGPIRAVSELQTMLGVGAPICQAKYMGMASQCQTEYMNRLVLVGLWCYYCKGCYVAMRRNDALTKSYVKQALTFVAVMTAFLAFSYVPNANAIVDAVFGLPRSFQGNVITVAGTAMLVMMEGRGLRTFVREQESVLKINTKAAKAA